MTTKRTRHTDGSIYTDGSMNVETVRFPGWVKEVRKDTTWTIQPSLETADGN